MRSVLYTDTCVICEEKGIIAQYYGETSASAGERSEQHLNNARGIKQFSHIWGHILKAHPDYQGADLRRHFRFDVVKNHRTAFERELSEVLWIKQSRGYVLNLKDKYTRCVIPDMKLVDRQWCEEVPERVKTQDPPRRDSVSTDFQGSVVKQRS